VPKKQNKKTTNLPPKELRSWIHPSEFGKAKQNIISGLDSSDVREKGF